MTTETKFNQEVIDALDKGTQFSGKMQGKMIHIVDKFEDDERMFAAWWEDHPNHTSIADTPAIALYDLPPYSQAGIQTL